MCFDSGQTVTNVPAQTAQASPGQIKMENITADFAEKASKPAEMLLNYGTQGFTNNQVNNPSPNWQNMFNTGNAQLEKNNAMSNDLVNGKVGTEFQKNMENSIRSGVNNTVGEAINRLGQKGIMNSGVTRKSMNDISNNVSNTVANNYNQALSSQSQLLNQNNQQQYQPTNFASAVQNTSIDIPAKYFALATGQTAPATDAWKTYMNQQTALSSPAQTVVSQNGPGLLGSVLGGAATAWACFVAGTKISMVEGDKNIEDVKIGDTLVTLDDNGDFINVVVLWVQKPKVSDDNYIKVETQSDSVITTATQEFKTTDGWKFADSLIYEKVITDIGEKVVTNISLADKELVYDISTSGPNTYLANGFLVKGRDM